MSEDAEMYIKPGYYHLAWDSKTRAVEKKWLDRPCRVYTKEELQERRDQTLSYLGGHETIPEDLIEMYKEEREVVMEIVGKIIGNHGAKIIVSADDGEIYEMPRMAAKRQLSQGRVLFEESDRNVRRVE